MELSNIKVPNHVAIIMDGNGRWAKKRFLPRIAGHKEGMNTVKKITIAASDLGVKVLTLYAFSTENWSRPQSEVSYLMGLPSKFFDTFVPDLIKNNVKVVVLGDVSQLPDNTRIAVRNAINDTSSCTGMILAFALNYGARQDILNAVNYLIEHHQGESVSFQELSQSLSTGILAPYNDPDLVIRTSGEQRLSNFLSYESAYSELYFTDTKWPDFTAQDLIEAFNDYSSRQRRFGGITEETE
ncbi:isoprenyl transferase [Bavariicoccus seileri]|uniref:isoprenyl transferase n=1 Tax=Bavariicoccus seileri TaxID=549685 RepID=UPI0003B32AB6|nr:isoprenyl transferase [Bavariicoccus seileri]